jgi:NAD(P)-dependent dehydrogenase (short-subunit alcohol dehydrogenase family)
MDQSATTARLRLENQVAVVTGGTRGIVRRFIEEGANVVFSGRSSDKGKVLEEELSPNSRSYLVADASSSDQLRERFRSASVEKPTVGLLAKERSPRNAP